MSKKYPGAVPGWLTVEQLHAIFRNYPTVEALRAAIRRDRFPVPTFRVGRRTYAEQSVVRAYFLRMKREGEEVLGRRVKETGTVKLRRGQKSSS